MTHPLYPDIRVSTPSRNPMALVARVRWALRQARVGQSEIDRFTAEALAREDPTWRRRICQSWVEVREGRQP